MRASLHRWADVLRARAPRGAAMRAMSQRGSARSPNRARCSTVASSLQLHRPPRLAGTITGKGHLQRRSAVLCGADRLALTDEKLRQLRSEGGDALPMTRGRGDRAYGPVLIPLKKPF